eukprot:TRINITY_DN7008_c0_g1_i3.p1 TRINITY_DN7008_c0_g1~~TRINITY_DN7008_c0_g1_i3.p1  ORF type:complete len:232 (+),score=34.79 TRINITY_DN7008_c0_g1_i3:168-863(+)
MRTSSAAKLEEMHNKNKSRLGKLLEPSKFKPLVQTRRTASSRNFVSTVKDSPYFEEKGSDISQIQGSPTGNVDHSQQNTPKLDNHGVSRDEYISSLRAALEQKDKEILTLKHELMSRKDEIFKMNDELIEQKGLNTAYRSKLSKYLLKDENVNTEIEDLLYHLQNELNIFKIQSKDFQNKNVQNIQKYLDKIIRVTQEFRNEEAPELESVVLPRRDVERRLFTSPSNSERS